MLAQDELFLLKTFFSILFEGQRVLRTKLGVSWAVVVAQLVEQSLPTPKMCGWNPNIGNVLSTNCNLNRKDKNLEKEAGNGPSIKKR